RFRRRDGVLPSPTRVVAKDVQRARRELERENGSTTARRRVGSETHAREAEQRHADDVLEARHVPMPPKLHAGTVFGDERLDERVFLETRLGPDTRAKRQQELRDGVGGPQRVAVEVVAAAVAHDAPLRLPTLVVGLLERQLAYRIEQSRLLRRGQKIRAVTEPGRITRRLEKLVLPRPGSGHRAPRTGRSSAAAKDY